VSCDFLSCQDQELSYLRLSDQQDNGDYELIGLYAPGPAEFPPWTHDLMGEGFENRMKWINEAAEIFNFLMRQEPAYMHAEIGTIARWVDSPDAENVY